MENSMWCSLAVTYFIILNISRTSILAVNIFCHLLESRYMKFLHFGQHITVASDSLCLNFLKYFYLVRLPWACINIFKSELFHLRYMLPIVLVYTYHVSLAAWSSMCDPDPVFMFASWHFGPINFYATPWRWNFVLRCILLIGHWLKHSLTQFLTLS